MKEGKFRSYDDLPLTLTVPEVGEVLGISRAKAYDLARSEGFPSMSPGFVAWRILCRRSCTKVSNP